MISFVDQQAARFIVGSFIIVQWVILFDRATFSPLVERKTIKSFAQRAQKEREREKEIGPLKDRRCTTSLRGVWLVAGRGKGGESGVSLSGLNSGRETKNPKQLKAEPAQNGHRAGANWTDRATCLPFDDVIRRPF